MPTVSEKQHNAMEAAAHGHSTLGIPEGVGKEFVEADKKADEQEEQDTELSIAKKIQSGELPSPQQYENLWLFNVRITGTGISYRKSLDEYVYRDPDYFLSPDFVDRCNGLSLIFEHPEDVVLDTEEFRQRSIGNCILPYVKDEDVWSVAKVYDHDAAELMQTTHTSTSPSVRFGNEGSLKVVMIDGKKLVIEGKPSLIDHLAICEVGVWDKGEDPSGIENSEDGEIVSEVKQEDPGEDAPAWAGEFAKRLDSLMQRIEAFEK